MLPSRTTDANRDCAFNRHALVSVALKIGKPGPFTCLLSKVDHDF